MRRISYYEDRDLPGRDNELYAIHRGYGKSYEIPSGKATVMGFESLKNRWVEQRNYDGKYDLWFRNGVTGLPGYRMTSVPGRKTGSPKGLRKKR